MNDRGRPRSVPSRLGVSFAVLLMLFLAVVLTQLVVTDRLHADEHRRAELLEQAHDANRAVLQHLTDAESGVRGYQLTGLDIFLDPYRSGRAGALAHLDRVDAATRSQDTQRLLAAERAAAVRWLDGYARPAVAAGPAEPTEEQTAVGKAIFDAFRQANADVDRAIDAERRAAADTVRTQSRIVQALFAGSAVIVVGLALALAAVHQRHLLRPLEHIRRTLQRLAAGDRTARAVPTGPAEMRAVIATLNGLAADTERLLAADAARRARSTVHRAVAAELRDNPDAHAAGRRIAEIVGQAVGAEAVYGRIFAGPDATVSVRWPADAPALPPDAVAGILAGRPGDAMTVPGLAGAVAVPLGADPDHPPGLICLVRCAAPNWTTEERLLLVALAREIDHAAHQRWQQHRQTRLIDELRALDERKNAFVATATHEMRTPLTSILGYTEMLADGDGGDLTPAQERGVRAIKRNAERLERTVADLLALDRGRDPARTQTVAVDLAQVAAMAAAQLRFRAGERGVTITGTGRPAWVCGDPRQLDRVVRNLLDNAVKFTRPGGRVTWDIATGTDGVVLTVADTGIGIPDGDVPALFTPFHRGANAMNQAVQGAGLGLAIVGTIVAEHGGTVQVHTELGAGSTFTVRLPAAAPAERPGQVGTPGAARIR